ncbi:hypothetical protein CC86DRAFT_407695 [Ophiobolus disseminans]|uniref:C3H1-type domain-containing protein n=1 Tax=Ophiobolus disseminans TaxID=1469910 RepID=A0A6A6ZYT8_9PLEO|nr:hypothetical protein CC86DRAFT_407695 [Ophiobolus disseminans]
MPALASNIFSMSPPAQAVSVEASRLIPTAASEKRKRADKGDIITVASIVANPEARKAFKKARYDNENAFKQSAEWCANAHHSYRTHHVYPVLDAEDSTKLQEDLQTLFRHAQDGDLDDHINEVSASLHKLAKGVDSSMTSSQVAALFLVHLARISDALSILDAVKVSHVTVKVSDLLYLQTSTIARLYRDLFEDHMWKNVLPHCNLSIGGVEHLRNSITLHRTTGLDAKVDKTDKLNKLDCKLQVIQKLLTPRPYEAVRSNLPIVKVAEAAQLKESQETLHAEREAIEAERDPNECESVTEFTVRQIEHALNEANIRHKAELDAHEKAVRAAEATRHSKDLAKALEEQKARFEEEARLKEDTWKKLQEARQAREAEIHKSAKFEKAKADEAHQAWRNSLELKCSSNKIALQSLKKLLRRGAPTPAELEILQVPSRDECIGILTRLWARDGHRLASIFPHELWGDEVTRVMLTTDLVEVQVAMTVMQGWGCPASEIVETGWKLQTMIQLQSSLVPYADGTLLASMAECVTDICAMLQQWEHEANPPPALPRPTMQPDSFATSLGSSISTQASSMFDSNLATSTNSFGTSTSSQFPPTPQNLSTHANTFGFSAPANAQADNSPSDIMSIEEDDAPTSGPHAASNSNFGDSRQGSNFSSTNFFQQGQKTSNPTPHGSNFSSTNHFQQVQKSSNPFLNGPPPAPQEKSRAKVCFNMRDKDTCPRGNNCSFSHDANEIQLARSKNAQAPTGKGSQYLTARMTGADVADDDDDGTWRANHKCRNTNDGNICKLAGCASMHAQGLHVSTGAPPSRTPTTPSFGNQSFGHFGSEASTPRFSNQPPRGPRGNGHSGGIQRGGGNGRGRGGQGFNQGQVNQLMSHILPGGGRGNSEGGQRAHLFGNGQPRGGHGRGGAEGDQRPHLFGNGQPRSGHGRSGGDGRGGGGRGGGQGIFAAPPTPAWG